jgi:CMP-N-acetylneuraminic acid synthetase
MNEMLAIIPARCGSKGVKNKNIKKLAGHPLLAYSIAAAKLARIEHIIVSTDSEDYAEIAKNYGAQVPFIRSSQISKDNSTDYEFMYHAMHWVREKKEFLPEYWVHFRPTTPLRNPEIINVAS